MILLLFLLFPIISAQLTAPEGYIFKFGVLVKPTKGAIFPQPQNEDKTAKFLIVKPELLLFVVQGNTCDILKKAIERTKYYIKRTKWVPEKYVLYENENLIFDPNFSGYLKIVTVKMTEKCSDNDYPHEYMDEEYRLQVKGPKASLTAKTIWGILRGLESLSQLFYLSKTLRTLLINNTEIHDYPRFPHRGLLLDTSRHYIEKEYILRNLRAMSYDKLNSFYWHIVDDFSFPYESRRYPQMSEKGAFHKAMTYSPEFINEVIEFGRLRGIRVIVQFESLGHTLSFEPGRPGTLTPCYGENGQPNGQLGPIDPTKNSTLEFVINLFREVADRFPDKYFHLGADEINYSCWASNPNINKWMTEHNMAGDYVALEDYYYQVITGALPESKTFMFFEEAFTAGVTIPPSGIIQVWKDETCAEVMKNVTQANLKALYACCWYVDTLPNGNWPKFYACDPHDFPGTAEELDLVLGGVISVWTEKKDANNLESDVHPASSAAAEILWPSKRDGTDSSVILEAAKRLEEHSCRLNNRGIRSQPPNGPSICLSSTSIFLDERSQVSYNGRDYY